MSRLLAALAIAAAGPVLAAPFADPTRPPTVSGSERPGAALPAGPRLESVLIAPDRRLAIVSGQELTIGSRLGDGEVIAITESEVRIRRPGGEESLKLFVPDAQRRPVSGKGK
jgi:MSHA biogenesis protein MshK